eukprot:gene19767-14297_t
MTSLIDYAYNVAYSAFVGLTIYQLINVLGEFAFGGTPQWHWRKYEFRRIRARAAGEPDTSESESDSDSECPQLVPSKDAVAN